MNITHAKNESVSGDKLEAIFNRQKELMEKYHHIEQRSGLLQTEDCPVNLNDKRGQARIKDFSWRVTEELGEALDAYKQNDEDHFLEELIDGLHFLTELTILSGIDINQICNAREDRLDKLINDNFTTEDNLCTAVTDFVETLGMMCNYLKNKPWKQTNMITDKDRFYEQLKKVWNVYCGILSIKMTGDDVVNIYLKKSQVNKFRQRSNY